MGWLLTRISPLHLVSTNIVNAVRPKDAETSTLSNRLRHDCIYVSSKLECMAGWFNPTLMSWQHCFIGVSGAEVQEYLALCTRLLDN